MAVDPICGMAVDERTSMRAERQGVTYYFCCEHCRRKFLGVEPQRPEGGEISGYFCPMCPEVHSPRPAACPICGMDLEPEVAASGSEVGGEAGSMGIRLRLAAAGSLVVVAVHMGGMIGLPLPAIWRGNWGIGWEWVFSTGVVFGAGWPILERAVRSLVNRQLNMFTLVGLGTVAAYAYSVFVVFQSWGAEDGGEVLPVHHGGPQAAGGVTGLYFESAAVITTLVLLGQVIEQRSRRRTGEAIRGLLDLAPPVASVVKGVEERVVPLGEVMPGDVLRVRPGEKVPVDGQVLDGLGSVSEAMITGEPVPVTKVAGDPVMGGTLNEAGTFTLRAERVGSQTLLAQIVQLIGRAQRSRAPIQRVADQVAAWFVPAVVGIAVATLGIWWLIEGQDGLGRALSHAIAVLIIACPCAIGLATPMSLVVGMGRGAREGVLVRDAEVLERLERVNLVALDKTGTITAGRPAVQRIVAAEWLGEEELLRLAAAVEQGSAHPLARAVVGAAVARGLVLDQATEFVAEVGRGVKARVNGRDVRVGTRDYCDASEVRPSAFVPLVTIGLRVETETPSNADHWSEIDEERHREEWTQQGLTVLYVSIDRRPGGLLALADPVQSTARAALQQLAEAGMQLVMLTGDGERTALEVARGLPLREIHAELLPQAKVNLLRRYQKEGMCTAMLGDGVNDAPALAVADVGVAMGTGSDIAIESAGVTLVRGDLRAFVRARDLSREVMRNIRQNLFFAFFYNVLGIPLAAGILVPWFGISLNPMFAAAAMSMSSVSVIANALRLNRSLSVHRGSSTVVGH
ncbi:MAG: heavy metal translocating P-type ATPase [Pirellulales bacterium]